jgi:hypothetical protein
MIAELMLALSQPDIKQECNIVVITHGKVEKRICQKKGDEDEDDTVDSVEPTQE